MIKSTKKRDKKVLKALYISVAVTFIVLIIYTALALAHHEDLADEVINRNIIDVPRTNRLTILDMIIFVVAIFILFIGRNSTFLVVLTLIALVICWFLLFATIVVSYQNRELDSKDDFSRRSIQCEECDTSLFRNGEDYDINKSLCDTSLLFAFFSLFEETIVIALVGWVFGKPAAEKFKSGDVSCKNTYLTCEMKCKIGNHDSIDEKTTTLPKDSPIEIETKESKKTLVNQ